MDLLQWISRPSLVADARALLAAMLQRIEPEVRQLGRFRMAVDGEDAALVVEFVEHGSQVIAGAACVRVKFPKVAATPSSSQSSKVSDRIDS